MTFKIQGRAAAKGIIEGIARVFHTPEEAKGQVAKNEILVTRTTNVNWTPMFSQIGGIVTEIGGMLCHAAVVAREMGIPGVVGAAGATENLDGKRIQINGATGEITVLT